MKKIFQYSLLFFTAALIIISTGIAYETIVIAQEEGTPSTAEFFRHIFIYFLIPVPGIFAVLFQIRVLRNENIQNQNEELDTMLIDLKKNNLVPKLYRRAHILFFLIVFCMGIIIIPKGLAHTVLSEPHPLQMIMFSFFGFAGIAYYLDLHNGIVK